MLLVISARCVARDLHTIVPGPLERAWWRRFVALWGDCKKSRIAPLNAIIIIIIEERRDSMPLLSTCPSANFLLMAPMLFFGRIFSLCCSQFRFFFCLSDFVGGQEGGGRGGWEGGGCEGRGEDGSTYHLWRCLSAYLGPDAIFDRICF